MMKIEFRTSGAAFQDEYADEATNDMYTRDEILRILKVISYKIKSGFTDGTIMDVNGNSDITIPPIILFCQTYDNTKTMVCQWVFVTVYNLFTGSE